MRKPITKICAFVLAIAMALPFMAACEKKKSPMEIIDAAITTSIKAMNQGTATELIQKVYEGGSVEVKLEAGPFLAASLGDLNASVKGYSDIVNGKFALTADLTSGGVSLADMLVYMFDNSVSVSSIALFGKDVYGFSLENLAENFNNSEFGENGTYSLGLSADQVQALLDSFAAPAKAINSDAEKYTVTMNSAWKSFTDDLYPMIESHGTIKTEAGTLEVGGNPYKTTDIVFTYTDEQLTAFTTDFLTLFRDHESIRVMIDTYMDLLSSYYTEEMLAMMEEDPSAFDADNVYTEYVDIINNLLANMDSVNEEITGCDTSITVHISETSQEIIGVSTYITRDANYSDHRFVCGPSVSDIDEIGICTKSYFSEDEELIEESASYRVTQDDDAIYAATLNLKGKNVEVLLGSADVDLLTLTRNKGDGTYTITVMADGQTVGIGGKYLEETDSLTLSANTISANGLTINFGELAVIYRANDPMPTMPTDGAYSDILTMDAEQIQAVITEAMTVVQQVVFMFSEYMMN